MSLVHTGIRHPKSIMKNVIPVVMAGGECPERKQRVSFCSLYACSIAYTLFLHAVIGIYGLIVGVILAQSIQTPQNTRENVYSIYSATAHVCTNMYACTFTLILL